MKTRGKQKTLRPNFVLPTQTKASTSKMIDRTDTLHFILKINEKSESSLVRSLSQTISLPLYSLQRHILHLFQNVSYL